MSIALSQTPITTSATSTTIARAHGILSAAQELHVDGPDRTAAFDGVEYETYCSNNAKTTPTFCLPDGVPLTDKESFTTEWDNLEPLIVMAMYACKSIGEPVSERPAKATDALEADEERLLEEKLQALIDADTDAAAGTAATAVEALGAALGAAGYPKGRIVHVSPQVAVKLAAEGAISRVGSSLVAIDGSPVVISVEYGTDTVTVTGPVLYVKGNLETYQPQLDQVTNQVYVLAERPWAIGYECAATVITITATP